MAMGCTPSLVLGDGDPLRIIEAGRLFESVGQPFTTNTVITSTVTARSIAIQGIAIGVLASMFLALIGFLFTVLRQSRIAGLPTVETAYSRAGLLDPRSSIRAVNESSQSVSSGALRWHEPQNEIPKLTARPHGATIQSREIFQQILDQNKKVRRTTCGSAVG